MNFKAKRILVKFRKLMLKNGHNKDEFKNPYRSIHLYKTDFRNLDFTNCDFEGLRFDNLKLTDCSFEGVDFTNLKLRRCTFVCFSFLNCNFNNCKFDSQKYIRTLDDIYFLKCFFEYKTDSKNLIEILNYYTVKMNDGLKVFIKSDN